MDEEDELAERASRVLKDLLDEEQEEKENILASLERVFEIKDLLGVLLLILQIWREENDD